MSRIRGKLISSGIFIAVGILPLSADEGRIEINQVRAIIGGVTPGDTAGFPVTLDQPGSYILTSDLDVTVLGLPVASDTTAIEVPYGIVGVNVDLNGFSIRGPAICLATFCQNAGTGVGILGGQVSVANGTIVGMGYSGILSNFGTIRNVLAGSNGGWGFDLTGGIITDATAYSNGSGGLSGVNVAVRDSTFQYNLGPGVVLAYSSANGLMIQSMYPHTGAKLSLSSLTHSLIAMPSYNAALECLGCSISTCTFVGCEGSDCYATDAPAQLPANSSLCGSELCP